MRIHPATAWRKCIRPAWVLLFVAFVSFLPLLMQAKEAVDTFSRLTPRHIFSSTASVGVRFVTAWKVAFDDKSSYADPNTSDSSWTLAGTTLLNPDSTQTQQWKGIGWFRLWLDVDSALVGHQVGMSFSKHRGASEIFLNGKRLYTLGVIAPNGASERVYQPMVIYPIVFAKPGRNCIAIRYANHSAAWFHRNYFDAGFEIVWQDFNIQNHDNFSRKMRRAEYRILFAAVPIAIGLLHFLLFAFYPQSRFNLYYALSVFCYGLAYFCNSGMALTTNPIWAVVYERSGVPLYIVMFMSLIFFIHETTYQHLPKRTPWIFTGAFLSVLYASFDMRNSGYVMAFWGVLMAVELVRSFFLSSKTQRSGAVQDGELLIIGIGGLFPTGVYVLQLLSTYADVSMPYSLLQRFVFGDPLSFAFLFFIAAVSMSLAKGIARTNAELATQLEEVQTLSEKAIEQERIAAVQTMERAVLEADNARKTAELEEARKLQLSMLPSRLPSLPDIEIAAFMQTATEVGGDYYDFCEAEDGSLVLAIGDATGHGSKAGYFVATTKSYFQSNVCRASLLELMHSISQGLRNMNLRGMFMALLTIRLQDRTLTLCNGGMPQPLLVKKDGSLEIIDSKALPLGAVRSAKYEELSRRLDSGDALILVSDGVTERFSAEQELYGLERLCEACRSAATNCASAEEIIDAIIAANGAWAQGSDGIIAPPHDDVTVVVIRAK